MNIVTVLKKLEEEIVSYADAAGKSIEQVGEEIIDFITGKKVEAQNADAAGANPTTSGPVAASTGSQVSGADTTARSSK